MSVYPVETRCTTANGCRSGCWVSAKYLSALLELASMEVAQRLSITWELFFWSVVTPSRVFFGILSPCAALLAGFDEAGCVSWMLNATTCLLRQSIMKPVRFAEDAAWWRVMRSGHAFFRVEDFV